MSSEGTDGISKHYQHDNSMGCFQGQPIVQVKEITQVHSVIDCPLCGSEHHHGLPPDDIPMMLRSTSLPSHRGAHCGVEKRTDVSGYFLVYTEHTDGLEWDDEESKFVRSVASD